MKIIGYMPDGDPIYEFMLGQFGKGFEEVTNPNKERPAVTFGPGWPPAELPPEHQGLKPLIPNPKP